MNASTTWLRNIRIDASLTLGFVLLGLVAPAAASTVGERVTVFLPGLGEKVITNGEPVEIEILQGDAAVESDIYLLRPFATVPLRQHLGTNRDVGKRVASQWEFARGEELQFEITVHSSDQTYSTGPGARNPDGLAHAWLTNQTSTSVTVGFEDVFGGGDRDYNDVVFKVRMATRNSGLDHRGLGGADLSASEDGQIVLSNLSDSGEDGMGVRLQAATGWRFRVSELQRASQKSVAEATLQGRGVVGGLEQEVGRARVGLEQERMRVSASFAGLAARGARVTLYGKKRRQLEQRVMSNGEPLELICPPLSFLSSIALTMTTELRRRPGEKITIVIDGLELYECTLNPVDLPVMAAGVQEQVTALELTAEQPAAEPELLSEAVLLTRGIPEMTLAREALQIRPGGPFHRGLGQATLDAAAGALTVGGLGSSGEDGVALDPGGPAGSVLLHFAPYIPVPPPADLVEGAFLELDARGFTGTAGENEFGRLRLTAVEGRAEVRADSSPVGSPTHRLLALEGTRAVADLSGITGSLAGLPAWPVRMLVGRFEVDGRSVWGYGLQLEENLPLEIPGGGTVVGDRLLVLTEAPAAPIGALTEVRLLGSQLPPVTLLDEAVAPACSPDERGLCLNGGRFRVEVSWHTPQGTRGAGQANQLTDDTGTFWFFDPDNLELVVKSLDACSFTDRFWFFAGGLTNVEVEMTVTDTLTGETRRYFNPQRTAFTPILDTSAFATCGQSAATSGRAIAPRTGSSASPRATPSSSSLLLDHQRFRVEVAWETPQGTSGVGQAVQLTENTGYFWFFDADNVELLVKTLDACSFADRFWVFAGGLTNVEVEMTVTDTRTGKVQRYHNAQQTPFAPILDTSAFATCP